VAVKRHVLAHNGGAEQRIVDHLATLIRTGGAVYLVDVDLTGLRIRPTNPTIEEMTDRGGYTIMEAPPGVRPPSVAIGRRAD
jgi:hypothetical protein